MLDAVEVDMICDAAEQWEDRDYLTDEEIAQILDEQNDAA